MKAEYRKLKLKELQRPDTEQYAQIEKLPIIVILDNIRSLHNIGSIFRSADAFLIQEIWLCGITAQPPHREIQKTALGATETVKWKYFKTAEEVITGLKEQQYSIMAVEQSTNSISPGEMTFDCDQQLAVVFGNEVDGVSEPFMSVADKVIEIPQSGTKHSLNVSVCAGIVLWELYRVSGK